MTIITSLPFIFYHSVKTAHGNKHPKKPKTDIAQSNITFAHIPLLLQE